MSKVQLQGNASGTGIFTIASPNSNTDRTLTLPDAAGTLQVSGNPISGTTGTFSGLIYANGGGVQFPATQIPSSDANCLDDYEEGTWNPLIQNSSGSESITLTGAGNYVKVGKIVWVGINAYATNSSAISAGAHIYLRGLPFSAGTITGAAQYVGSVMSQYPAQPVSLIDIASGQAPMYVPSGAQDWSVFSRNSWGGATSISWRMSFCYMASA